MVETPVESTIPLPGASVALGQEGARPSPFLDADGALLRERPDDRYVPWTAYPATPERARLLAAGYDERELAVVRAVEARQYLTIDQLARRFYGTPRYARKTLPQLYRDRMLARLDPTPPWMGRAIGAVRCPPWVFHLDWNGRWALELPPPGKPVSHQLARRQVHFDPATIALPHQGTGHLLGVNEIWSLFLALARRSYGAGGPSLAVGWRDELAAQIHYGRRRTEVVQPDAEIVLRAGLPAWHPEVLAQEAARPAWQRAELAASDWPTAALLQAQVQPDATVTAVFRTLLLEFETGSQHPSMVEKKIQGYNTLIGQRAVWEARFGPRFPRLLVVVRSRDAILPMVALWRQHFIIQPKPGSPAVPVLITSIPDLIAADGQAEGLRGACWIHAMDPDRAADQDLKEAPPRRLRLSDALGLPDL